MRALQSQEDQLRYTICTGRDERYLYERHLAMSKAVGFKPNVLSNVS